MAESSAIPVVVLSRQQDPVELINSALRNAGQVVHCRWVREAAGLGEALSASVPPQLIFLCVPDGPELDHALNLRERLAARVPVLLAREALTEADLVRALELGAQDVVTLTASSRLQAVAIRELAGARVDRALHGTLASARQYRDQMRAFMEGSTDAIAHVQEGIVVEANPAWSELFGRVDPAELLGQPLMDFFEARSHAALKGALVAAVQGKWAGHALSAVAALADGSGLPLELELEPFEHEGEPAVRLRVATRTPDVAILSRQLEEALRLDPRTGLLQRASFLEAATERAAAPLKAGLRSLAYVAPDGFDLIERSHGPLAAEGALEGIARRIREQLQPGDLASRVAPRGICILFERGNARDQDSWIERLLERIAASPLEAGQVKISL
ncbi:MAG: GGDEF domain-containing response regulator, partial [Steroidobacteraceae bacterium]